MTADKIHRLTTYYTMYFENASEDTVSNVIGQ